MMKDVPDFDRLWKAWVKTFHTLVEDTKLGTEKKNI